VICGGEGQTVDPSRCSDPGGILLVGESNGVVDPLGQFVIVVRDLKGIPIVGVEVTVAFNQNGGGLLICGGTDEQGLGVCTSQPFQGLTVDFLSCCKYVRKTTDIYGQAIFRIMGNSIASYSQYVNVYVCGVKINTFDVPVATLDLNGSGTVNSADLSVVVGDMSRQVAPERSDFDFNGQMSANDLSLFLNALFANGSITGCGVGGAHYCN
jgi:hypothetical protein